MRAGGRVAAGLRLLWDDTAMWGSRPGAAGYVHGLAVDRSRAGTGLGAALLAWAARETRARARLLLRLDCVEANTALRAYYRGQGFTPAGRRDLPPPLHAVVLLEKRLP